MKSKASQILAEIKKKKEELIGEYIKLKDKYGFTIEKGKIVFNSETRKYNRTYKRSVWDSFFSVRMRELLSAPFIYSMIIPSLILDIFLTIYMHICFRLYKIPLVKRNDYIEYDRKKLDYLNWMQKLNCLYCSYVNGLYSYATEIAGRTERYWCPIKYAKDMKGGHNWQIHFADYGDPKGFKEACNRSEAFRDIKD